METAITSLFYDGSNASSLSRKAHTLYFDPTKPALIPCVSFFVLLRFRRAYAGKTPNDEERGERGWNTLENEEERDLSPGGDRDEFER